MFNFVKDWWEGATGGDAIMFSKYENVELCEGYVT